MQSVANEYNFSNATVYNISREYGAQKEKERIKYFPKVLGVDEAHLNKAMRGFFVDIEKHGIIGILPSRSKENVIQYFESLPNRKNIKVVTMDMW